MKAEDLAEIIDAKLAKILIADGFHTDMGLKVFRGRRQILPSDVPCVVVIEGDDRIASSDLPTNGMEQSVLLNQHYIFEGYAVCDDEWNPNNTGHQIIRDIKRVIFAPDPTLAPRQIKSWRYGGRLIGVRNDGTSILSCSVELNVGFVENLASP